MRTNHSRHPRRVQVRPPATTRYVSYTDISRLFERPSVIHIAHHHAVQAHQITRNTCRESRRSAWRRRSERGRTRSARRSRSRAWTTCSRRRRGRACSCARACRRTRAAAISMGGWAGAWAIGEGARAGTDGKTRGAVASFVSCVFLLPFPSLFPGRELGTGTGTRSSVLARRVLPACLLSAALYHATIRNHYRRLRRRRRLVVITVIVHHRRQPLPSSATHLISIFDLSVSIARTARRLPPDYGPLPSVARRHSHARFLTILRLSPAPTTSHSHLSIFCTP